MRKIALFAVLTSLIAGLPGLAGAAGEGPDKLAADLQDRIAAGERDLRVIVSYDPALDEQAVESLRQGQGRSRMARLDGVKGLAGRVSSEEVAATRG